jgi:hypothetical protein
MRLALDILYMCSSAIVDCPRYYEWREEGGVGVLLAALSSTTGATYVLYGEILRADRATRGRTTSCVRPSARRPPPPDRLTFCLAL